MNITPEPRIGDREREAAAAALGEHYAAGRLDKDEYDQRCTQAWSAMTDADLRPLFADLPPARSPGHQAGHPGARRPTPVRTRRVPVLPLVVLALVLVVLVPSPVWFILGVAAVAWFGGCLRPRSRGGSSCGLPRR